MGTTLNHVLSDPNDAADELELLRALVEPAQALVKKIGETGTHDNWKRLANALHDLDQHFAAMPISLGSSVSNGDRGSAA